MPLIKCDECGRKISDQSRFCPRCGHPTHLNSAYRELHGDPRLKADENMDTESVAEPIESPEEIKAELEKVREEDGTAVNIDDLDRAAILAETRRKNDRMKTWIFIGVMVAVLGLIVAVYCLTPKDTGVKESVTEDDVPEVTVTEPTTDTVPKADITKLEATTATAAPVEKKQPAKSTPEEVSTPTPAAPQPNEVTVAPLSEQAAPIPPEATPAPTPNE